MNGAVRDRVRLLRMLGVAGPGLLVAIIALIFITSLVPAATAVTLALLVGQVRGAGTAHLLAAAAGPLLGFAGVLLLGHALGSVREPLYYLARARIDGAHRARVARLASTSDTIGALEPPEVQRLLREARADPADWTERTPAAGALSQLGFIGRGFSMVSTSLVLAAYRWWLVPLLLASAVTHQQLNRAGTVSWYRRWRAGIDEGMRAEVWTEAIFSPSDGQEIRVFGLGGWGVARIGGHLRALYEPVWGVARQILRRGPLHFLALVGPLLIAFLAVSLAAVRHEASIGVTVAVLSASAGVYQIFGGDPRDVIGGLASLRAYQGLRAELDGAAQVAAGPGVVAATDPVPVRFEGIGFSYPGVERQVLAGLDLEIRPGELLAIVGLNGAGKSTLIKLLAGLYQPTAGRITVGGVDVTRIGPVAWRRRLAVVFQDFVRYQLSVADNVALGNATVPRDEAALAAAARDAGRRSGCARGSCSTR